MEGNSSRGSMVVNLRPGLVQLKILAWPARPSPVENSDRNGPARPNSSSLRFTTLRGRTMNKGLETPFFMKFRQISRLKIGHLLINFAKQFLCWLNIFQDKRTSRDSAKHHEKETLLILPTPNHESYWSACWLDLIWPVIKIILCKFIIHNFPTCIKGKV